MTASALIVVVCSCSKGPRLYPVKGSVLVNGKPEKDIVVGFVPTGSTDATAGGGGLTNDKGEFSATSVKPGDGLQAGDYIVTFEWTMDRMSKHPGPDRLQGRYSSKQKSPFRAKVEAKSNELPPYEIKGDVLPYQDPNALRKSKRKSMSPGDKRKERHD